MKIEHERDRDYRRWSIELEDWLVRLIVLAVVMVLVPGAGVAAADIINIIAK
jgi:hypothetical protein